jgi:hypothetical protein
VRHVRTSKVRVVLLCSLVLVGAPDPAPAQAGPSTSGGVLSRIRPGAMVRARLGPERTITGTYLPIGDGRLGVSAERGTTDTLRLDELGELAVRGRHTRTGAIVGGAAGVALGAFIGLIITATCDAAACDRVGPYFVTVPLFGAGGALLGGAVGAAIPKWRRVLP